MNSPDAKHDSAFGFEAAEDSPGFLLWQTTVVWQRMIKKALIPYGITHPQFVIMAILLWFEEQQQPPTQIALSRMSKLDKMTISVALKHLVANKWVKRQESEQDTRAKDVMLTAAGKKLITKLVGIVEATDEAFFSALRAGEREKLITILRGLSA